MEGSFQGHISKDNPYLRKLDARTRMLILSANPPRSFSALVRTKDRLTEEQKAELGEMGVTVTSHIATTMSVRIEVKELLRFLSLEYIVKFEGSQPLFAE